MFQPMLKKICTDQIEPPPQPFDLKTRHECWNHHLVYLLVLFKMATILTVFKSKESWSLSNFKLILYCPETLSSSLEFLFVMVFVFVSNRPLTTQATQSPKWRAQDDRQANHPTFHHVSSGRFSFSGDPVDVFRLRKDIFVTAGDVSSHPRAVKFTYSTQYKVQKTNLGCDVSRMWCFNVFELQTDFKKVPSGCEWRNAASSKVHHLSTVLMEEIRLTTWDVRINPCK